jgi:hypothetical protein
MGGQQLRQDDEQL